VGQDRCLDSVADVGLVEEWLMWVLAVASLM
jgi:hypothetical protein